MQNSHDSFTYWFESVRDLVRLALATTIEASPAPTASAFSVADITRFHPNQTVMVEVTPSTLEQARILTIGASNLITLDAPLSAAPSAGYRFMPELPILYNSDPEQNQYDCLVVHDDLLDGGFDSVRHEDFTMLQIDTVTNHDNRFANRTIREALLSLMGFNGDNARPRSVFIPKLDYKVSTVSPPFISQMELAILSAKGWQATPTTDPDADRQSITMVLYFVKDEIEVPTL